MGSQSRWARLLYLFLRLLSLEGFSLLQGGEFLFESLDLVDLHGAVPGDVGRLNSIVLGISRGEAAWLFEPLEVLDVIESFL